VNIAGITIVIIYDEMWLEVLLPGGLQGWPGADGWPIYQAMDGTVLLVLPTSRNVFSPILCIPDA